MKKEKLKSKLLHVLMVIVGLNVFVACYGMPPEPFEPVEQTQDEQVVDQAPEVELSAENAE